jgi:hypothetical protein
MTEARDTWLTEILPVPKELPLSHFIRESRLSRRASLIFGQAAAHRTPRTSTACQR